MNAIINVTQNVVGNKTIETVNARALHEFLGVGRDFSEWIKSRIEKYDFTEGSDYVTAEILSTPDLGSTKARPQMKKEYHVSISMAKEMSMVENNVQGKEARKYFIACEDRLNNTPKGIILDNPMQLRAALLAYTETVIALEESVLLLTGQVEKQLPAVEFVKMFVERGLNSCLTDAFKGLGVNPNLFMKHLRKEGVLFKRLGCNINHAKQCHINAGLFVARYNTFTTQTLITPKGVLWVSKNYKEYLEENTM